MINYDGQNGPEAFEDFDDNGVPDAFEDFNGDGVPDAFTDFNNTDTPDAFEDFNGNGTPDAFEDFNANGTPDAFEDFNGNGIPDAFEDFNGNGTPDAFEDFDSNGVPEAFESQFVDLSGNGIPDFFDTVHPSTIQSPTHPDAHQSYVNATFTATWNAANFLGMQNGWLWVKDRSSDTIVTLENSQFLPPATTTVTIPLCGFGEHWFHMVPLNGENSPVPNSQKSFKFVVGINAPAISSSSHPSGSYWYNNDDFSGAWVSEDAALAASGWRWKLASGAPFVGDLTAGNSTSRALGSTTLALTDRAHGSHWLYIAPVDAEGTIINERKSSFRFNVNKNAPSVTSSSHPDQNTVYSAANVQLAWSVADVSAGSASAYYLMWNDDPLYVPTEDDEMTVTQSKSYVGQNNGTHYFHIVAADRLGNLTPVRRFRVNINTIDGPPAGTARVEAQINADIVEGVYPLSVAFTESSTGDIDDRIWSFGDGSLPVVNPAMPYTKTYTTPGIYTASLTVTGNGYDYESTDTVQINVLKKPATVLLSNLSHTYDGTAKSASTTTEPPGLVVTVTYDGETTLPSDAGTYAVGATVDDAQYAGEATGELIVAQRAAAVAADAQTKTYGDPDPILTYTVLTGPVAGDTFSGSLAREAGENVGVYAISGGTLTLGPNYDLGITPATLTISRATPVINWEQPSWIAYGTPLSAAQLNALANTEGTYDYTPAVGTILPVGEGQTLQVDFTPADPANWETASKTVTIDVLNVPCSLTVNSAYGTPSPAVGSHDYDWGTQVESSVASPVDGGEATRHVCTGWEGTGSVPDSGLLNSVDFTLTENSTLTWLWRTEYFLTVSVAGNGNVDVEDGWRDEAQNVVITATPDAGTYFAGWTGDTAGCVLTGNIITVPMTAKRTLTANFSENPPVATPALSPEGGLFQGDQVSVTLTCATPGVTIYYTMGSGIVPGDDPTAETAEFVSSGESVQIPVPGWLKAVAIDGEGLVSLVAAGIYEAAPILADVTVECIPSSVVVGQTFEVRIYIQDLSPDAPGIRGGPLDVLFDPVQVGFSGTFDTSSILQSPFNTIQTNGTLDAGGGIVNELGGVTTQNGLGDGTPVPYAVMTFEALTAGEATFTTTAGESGLALSPPIGQIAPVNCLYGGTSITIDPYYPGDGDGDGDVDFNDLTWFIGHYGEVLGAPNWDAKCDGDKDGDVDFNDLTWFIGLYGTNYNGRGDAAIANPGRGTYLAEVKLEGPTVPVAVGETFEVKVYVKDLTAEAFGVRGGPLDVVFDTAMIDYSGVFNTDSIVQAPYNTIQTNGTLDEAGGKIDELGGVTTQNGHGDGIFVLYANLTFEAVAPGSAIFQAAAGESGLALTPPVGQVDVSAVNYGSPLTVEVDDNLSLVRFTPGLYGTIPSANNGNDYVVQVENGQPAPSEPPVVPNAGWEHTGWDWNPVVRSLPPATITQDWTATATYADIGAPVISVDPAEVTLVAGTANPDVLAGVTATDNADGDVTANIVVGGVVDIGVPGDYVVTYNVSDAAGNPAVQQTRTYHVVDKWLVALTLDTGDFPALYFGADIAATDGYDDGVDDLLPGEGPVVTRTINNFAGLYRPKGADTYSSYFLRDVRKLGGDYYWVLEMESFEGSITAAWDAATLPGGVNLRIVECDRDGNTLTPDDQGWPMADLPHQVTADVAAGVKYYRIWNADAEESFELDLAAGWNLVSIPIAPVNPAVEVVFADINLGRGGESLRDGRRGRLDPGSVYDWNEDTQSYHVATRIEAFEGYWIHVDPAQAPLTVSIVGLPATEPENLTRLWNLRGVLAPVASLDAGVSSSVWYWLDGEYFRATAGNIIPGFAYWFFTLEDDTPLRGEQ